MQNQNEDLIQLAMKTLGCTEEELITRLKASPKQISRWKRNGDRYSKITNKIEKLMNIGDLDLQYVIWSRGVENANKWDKLIHYLADMACNCAETGYITEPLKDELGSLNRETFYSLHEMGVIFPENFPTELDIQYETGLDDDVLDCVMENPYADLIFNIFCSFNSVYGFYEAYINELVENGNAASGDAAFEVICNLMSLAACKTSVDLEMAPNFQKFQQQVVSAYKEWLTIIRDNAIACDVPIRVDLFALINCSTDDLDLAAEAESFGLNEVLLKK